MFECTWNFVEKRSCNIMLKWKKNWFNTYFFPQRIKRIEKEKGTKTLTIILTHNGMPVCQMKWLATQQVSLSDWLFNLRTDHVFKFNAQVWKVCTTNWCSSNTATNIPIEPIYNAYNVLYQTLLKSIIIYFECIVSKCM